MLILLQLVIFLVVIVLRGRSMFGLDLKPQEDGSNRLYAIVENKGRVLRVKAGLVQKGGFPFVIRKERAYHKILKAIGIAKEISIGDADLDGKYYFITDDPDHVARALGSVESRELLKQMEALNVTSVHATTSRIWTVGEPSAGGKVNQKLYVFLENLQKSLHQAMRQDLPRSNHQPAPMKLRHYAYTVLMLHLGLLVTGISGVFMPVFDDASLLDYTPWMKASFIFAAPLLFMWLLVLIVLFRGTSWAGWILFDFLVSGVVGLMLCTSYTIRETNIRLDDASVQSYYPAVVERSCRLHCWKRQGKHTRTRNYKFTEEDCQPGAREERKRRYEESDPICSWNAQLEYFMNIENWRPSKLPTYHFETNSGTYDASPARTIMQVDVHPGALDLEWVVNDDIKPANRAR